MVPSLLSFSRICFKHLFLCYPSILLSSALLNSPDQSGILHTYIAADSGARLDCRKSSYGFHMLSLSIVLKIQRSFNATNIVILPLFFFPFPTLISFKLFGRFLLFGSVCFCCCFGEQFCCCLSFVLWQVSVCSFSLLGTHCVDAVVLEFTEVCLALLELKACTQLIQLVLNSKVHHNNIIIVTFLCFCSFCLLYAFRNKTFLKTNFVHLFHMCTCATEHRWRKCSLSGSTF